MSMMYEYVSATDDDASAHFPPIQQHEQLDRKPQPHHHWPCWMAAVDVLSISYSQFLVMTHCHAPGLAVKHMIQQLQCLVSRLAW
jgi:hypothetical protein